MATELVGNQLSIGWALPFVGILFSIAAGPILAEQCWHRHCGKVMFAWVMILLIPFAFVFGLQATMAHLVHMLLVEYIPFLILLTSLFVVAGGIYIHGKMDGTPLLNTALLALGTVLASLMGTTGASMLLIRPLIRANARRQRTVHIIIFFIFLVANIGGSLTPLGDPPLFLGFLKGVDFFWTLRHLLPETLFVVMALLVIFYYLDRYYYSKEPPSDPTAHTHFYLDGKVNFILLAAIAGLVLMSGLWKTAIVVSLFGTAMPLPELLRDGALLVIIAISLWITPRTAHVANHFNWHPILEIAKLFIGIFVTIIPVIALLRAGSTGALSMVAHTVTDAHGQPINAMYFWITGLLSAFLDNAPTYLIFFNLASGQAQVMMTTLAKTLAAISAGAVFMGAISYIGNAPNLMVKSIAESRGIKMPSFFAYMAWSFTILIPLFIVVTLIFFI